MANNPTKSEIASSNPAVRGGQGQDVQGQTGPQNMMMPAVGKGAPFPQPPLPPPDTPMDGPHDMATNQPMQFVPQMQADAVFHILMGAITSILRQWILTQEECTQLLQTAQIDAPIVVWSDDLAMVWATPGCFEESHGDYQHEVCGVWF